MRIPFRAIGVFFAVSSNKSIAAAAKELFVTPSAVSQQIKTLEEQLGTTLLLKDGRGIKLTEAGERGFTLLNIRGTPKSLHQMACPPHSSFPRGEPRYRCASGWIQ